MADPVDRSTGEVLNGMALTEEKLGLVPLSRLLPRRQQLVDRVATLRAKYSAWGTFDALRKIELSRLKGLIRAQATRDKRKVSALQVDEEAHAHADYVEFVTLATSERATWAKLEARIEAIDFTIQRTQVLIRYATSELHL